MNLLQKKFKNFVVYFQNEEEFKKIYQSIFLDKEYDFSTHKSNPFIIDCGSHIGLNIIYQKISYPNATIIGFEPNPINFIILKKNIQENKFSNVNLFNVALSNRKGVASLHTTDEVNNPWTWGDSIVKNIWGEENGGKDVEVKTTLLSEYITKPVDFIKMDIEGMEQKVVQEIELKLHLVNEIIIEFHQTKTIKKINSLSLIINTLNKHKFRIKLKNEDLIKCFPKDFSADEFIKELDYNVCLVYAKNPSRLS